MEMHSFCQKGKRKAVKFAYKIMGLLIWLAGVLLFVRAMAAGSWTMDFAKTVTMIGFAVAACMSIFSFLYGAQPGHYVRFVMIMLFSLLCLLTYLNEVGVVHGGAYRGMIFSVVIVMVLISNACRRKFREEYRRNGRVDYFEIYFKSQ